MTMNGHASPDATMTAIPRVIAARPDGMTTIGVALKVPEPYATQIRAAREAFGDPQANSIPTHVTLIAPAEIPMHSLPAIDAHLTAVSNGLAPFRIQLRGTATFRPVSPVVFVAVVEGISGCERIEKAVRRGPLLRRRRFPYHPHVTLVHNMPEDVLDKAFAEFEDFSAVFAADHLSLFQQDTEGIWHPIRDYRLQA
jgi:2'-5' RNA ligase